MTALNGSREGRAHKLRLTIAVLAVLAVGQAVALASSSVEAPRERKRRAQNAGDKKSKKDQAKRPPNARQRARHAIKSGDLELARALLRSGLKTKDRSKRDAWRIVQSELEYAKKNYAKAGLTAMRIVILRPKSAHVGAALYWAARAYERLGRPSKAAELFEECLTHDSTKRSMRRKSEERLKELKKQPGER